MDTTHEIEMMEEEETILHVEACMMSSSTETADSLRQALTLWMELRKVELAESGGNRITPDDPFLKRHLKYIEAEELIGFDIASPGILKLDIHVFQLAEEGADEEALAGSDSVACRTWSLPCQEFHGMWNSLVYDPDIRSTLLDYTYSAMLFSEAGIDPHLITWNRLVLLHGPPGTGKTSLAKALAQKLSIRLSKRYPVAQLIEINAHSLFSKWFSESGKLVMAMFKTITDLLEDADCFVCVLIDEVESLTAARNSVMAGTEPSDAIRVVNALLTQLDAIKAYPNVLVLTTSNLPSGIDDAFVDRADLKLYVGNPGHKARYTILGTCLKELARVNIITDVVFADFLNFEAACALGHAELPDEFRRQSVGQSQASMILFSLTKSCEDMSGRSLRKLPFTAHACFVKKPRCTMSVFLSALKQAITTTIESKKQLERNH